MRKTSSNRCRRYKRGRLVFKWCGGHTINVFERHQATTSRGRPYDALTEIDVISFGYSEGDERPTAAAARAAITRHLRYRRGED